MKCQVIEEFYNIFGPELKAVTGDPRHVEETLKRVDALVKPIEEVHNHFIYFHYIFWNFSKLFNGGISLNWSIDEVTTRNTTAYVFGPPVYILSARNGI